MEYIPSFLRQFSRVFPGPSPLRPQVSRRGHVPHADLGAAPGSARDAGHRKVPGRRRTGVWGLAAWALGLG